MKLTILFGGEAGQGPNLLSNILGKALVKRGYYVFVSREYQSVIRGGHNFNVLTFSDKSVYSNESKLDMIIALDSNTEKIHRKKLKTKGIILKGHDENMYYAGKLFKLLCLDFKVLENELKELEKRFEENIKEAKKGYEDEGKKYCEVKFLKKNENRLMNGNQGIAEGAIKSGVDVYYAYPMTPATPVLGELAEKQTENNFFVLELENEIAVMNAAVGSSITGAKTMIGTSGGGFDLMTEALSLAGMAEVPVVCYLASRPGPSTGLATETGQGDLQMARHSGHGEFPRAVVAPGDSKECEELISQAFYFSQKFKIPVIVLSDKHLAESMYTLTEKPKITESNKTTKLGRYNSYEHTGTGEATEDAEVVNKNVEKRLKKQREIEKEAEKFRQYEVYGKKNSKNIVVSWGSPKGAILDAVGDLDCSFVQILYLEPFPKDAEKHFRGKNLILVENNATGQLGKLIAEKTGIFIDEKNKILRYDGRPFLSDELSNEIKRRLR